jgi:hypothetical protein
VGVSCLVLASCSKPVSVETAGVVTSEVGGFFDKVSDAIPEPPQHLPVMHAFQDYGDAWEDLDPSILHLLADDFAEYGSAFAEGFAYGCRN